MKTGMVHHAYADEWREKAETAEAQLAECVALLERCQRVARYHAASRLADDIDTLLTKLRKGGR